jgi:hypothetical protein
MMKIMQKMMKNDEDNAENDEKMMKINNISYFKNILLLIIYF